MQYQFKNFEYQLLKNNSTDRFQEVRVDFLANENQISRFLFIEKKGGVNFVNEAKKIIDSEIKSGKLKKYAKHYLHPNRPRILQTVVLATLVVALLSTGGYFLGQYLTSQRNDIVLLYTNDAHGHLEKELSYATVASMKQDFIKQGKDVILMDAGDHLSGSIYAVYDKGETVSTLMDEAGYDVATFGNHEFDHGFARLDEIRKKVNYEYICSNLYHLENGKPTTRYAEHGSRIFNVANRKIGVIGIATPKSISDSSPVLFQDKNGNYIYSFLDGNDGKDLYNNVQAEVDYLKGQGCNYVIALSHLGEQKDGPINNCSSDAVVKNTSGIDIVIDGHTHSFIPGATLKNKNGDNVLLVQAGCFFDYVGAITISPNGAIINNFYKNYLRADEAIKQKNNEYYTKIDNEYDEKIASSDIDFLLTKEGDEPINIGNTNFGDLCADSFYYYANYDEGDKIPDVDIAFVNAGGIRVDVKAGDWKIMTCFQIFPFANTFVIRRIKGSLLKTALEWGARKAPQYFGGFLPCAGLTYSINTSVITSFEESGGVYISGPNTAERRVIDPKVYNRKEKKWEELNDEKEYLVAGASYTLLNSGDGASFFAGENDNIHTVYPEESAPSTQDFQVLVNYVKHFAKDDSGYPKIATEQSPLKDLTDFKLDYEEILGGKRVKLINI